MLPAGEGAVGVCYGQGLAGGLGYSCQSKAQGGDPRGQGSGWGALGFSQLFCKRK